MYTSDPFRLNNEYRKAALRCLIVVKFCMITLDVKCNMVNQGKTCRFK